MRREEQIQRTAASPDDALIETYLKHKNVTGYYEREARAVWALYKQLTNGKPLKDASRDEGRNLVVYYEKQDLKSATIQKLRIVPERDDKQRRLPLNETNIRKVKRKS